MKKQMAVWITAGTLLTLATGVPALAETVRTETYSIYNGSGTLDGSVDTNDPVGVDVNAQESGAAPENVSVKVTGDVKVQNSNADYEHSVSGVHVYSDFTDAPVNVSIGQDDDDENHTGGTVTVKSNGENETANGVKITNEGTGPVNVNTGKIDVTATGGYETNGASVFSHRGQTDLTIYDGISARNNNAYTTGLSIDDCGPTEMPEEGGAHSTVMVYGNIEASSKNKDATGVSLNSEHNDLPDIRSEAYIYGNVTADSTSGNATGVKQYIRDGASHIFIDDITAKTKTGETAVGVDLTANGGTENIYVNGGIHAEGGEATGVSATLSGEESSNIIIEVTNGIFATGTEDSAGIRIGKMIDAPILSSDSEITIVSDENVESSGTGIVDMNTINGVKTNLVVQGAVIAEAGPAVSVVTQSLSSLDLTVWKLESKTGSLVAEKTENGYVSTDTAKKVEQSIDYIIQVAPNASDYTDLTATQKTVAGYTYDVGKAGEKIAVTFHVPDGFTIDSAYSDESGTALQHVSGNEFLLVVPNGGGVMINLKLVPFSNNGGGEDDNYSGNPPAEYESHNFSRSGSHYSLTLRKNQMEVVLSTAELKALLESGLTELTFMTSAGNFTFPSADLWTMANNFATVRFAVEEGHMNAYGDNNAAAFKTVDPDVVENTVS